jgi:hypothetical protein
MATCDLDREITALNRRRPDAANAAGVRPVDWITPAFAEYLKIPDPKAGGRSGRVDLAIYGRRANWTRGNSWRA